MPRPSISATVVATVEVQIKSVARAMLKARFEEHVRLAHEIAERTSRQDRLKKEVEELFAKDGQEAALDAGTTLDGFKVKRVTGTQSTLNKKDLMQAFDLTPDELDAFYDVKPKRPHIKITAPGQKDEM